MFPITSGQRDDTPARTLLITLAWGRARVPCYCSLHGLRWHYGTAALLLLGSGKGPDCSLSCLWYYPSGEEGNLVNAEWGWESRLPHSLLTQWRGSCYWPLRRFQLPTSSANTTPVRGVDWGSSEGCRCRLLAHMGGDGALVFSWCLAEVEWLLSKSLVSF